MTDNKDLFVFEAAVYGGKETEECIALLFPLLESISMNECTIGEPRFYARLAGTVTSLFSRPGIGLSAEGFVKLCVHHSAMHTIFRATSFENADHILDRLGVPSPDGGKNKRYTQEEILLLLVFWSFESRHEFDFRVLYQALPEATHAALVGLLSNGVTLSERSYESRVKLMGLRDILEAHPLVGDLAGPAAELYMYCTYMSTPDRHEVKKIVNTWLRPLAPPEHALPLVPTERKERPTVVVPVEWFNSSHAMFRCYAPMMAELRTKFRLVCIAGGQELDDTSMFDKVINIVRGRVPMEEIIAKVAEEAPDIVFYPSIGMSSWCIVLANLRLAPIQLMCAGHPASSFSPHIDYLLSERGVFGHDALYSERLLEVPVGAPYLRLPGVARRGGRGMSDIAVPAMLHKLTPPFLNALKRIKEARPKLVYHFFPNQWGMRHAVAEAEIKRWFPDCVVYPSTDYQTYLDNLSKSHMALDTFPFNGTNTVVDCLLSGLPVVTLEGDEISERTGALMLRKAGMPEWLITHSIDEYVGTALNAWMAEDLVPLEQDLASVFFAPSQGHVVDTFVQLYEGQFTA